ncbi:putative urea active transporter 2 [Cyberlindnera fabianii]|uniref:Putative urea active transporter 2 n=1 Tax=Cyberlindnera fabianii TaxID=36022 RepID=A0A1V2LCU4_CYBFA|nr:putative urea active transporter 2 [Cyberlindnera fabianii]
MLSSQASNAIMYITYGVLLITGLLIAWKVKSKAGFLSANQTQAGLPLALNFVASGLGCGILSTYPQVANLAGLHGLLVYAVSGGLPMFLFAFFGPMLRKRCPSGFVLTEWVFHRFGLITGLYLSACTILTLFLFMVSEIASLQYAVETLTGLSALPAAIVQCVVTTIYTAAGGFKVAFITDTVQIVAVLLMLIIVTCSIGAYIDIDRSSVDSSGLLKDNLVGWQLVYILPVAIFTNDLFLSGFWLRTFAARSDKDLWIGCSIAAFFLTCIAALVGVTGLLAVWAGWVEIGSYDSSASLFIILQNIPAWVSAFTLIFVVAISVCTLGSLQSGLTSTISNDIFRNKVPLIYIRGIVVLIIVPVIVVGLKVADDVLQIYFIADLLSAAVIPIIMLGLWDKLYFMTGYEVISGGLGGLLAVFIFGTIYYHSAKEGGKLLLIWNGIYGGDWGCFAAFVVAPFGSLLVAAIVCCLRLTILKVYSKVTGKPFTALDKPAPTKSAEEDVEEDADSYERTSDVESSKDHATTTKLLHGF